MRGRKPKPTREKLLSGNAGKREINVNEPKPEVDDSMLVPPSWLDAVAQQEWHYQAPGLIKTGVLTVADRVAFTAYCKSYSRWYHAERAIDAEDLKKKPNKNLEQKDLFGRADDVRKSNGEAFQQITHHSIAQRYLKAMLSLASEFGLTPASRTRIQSEPGGSDDDFEKFASRKPAPRAQAAVPGELSQ